MQRIGGGHISLAERYIGFQILKKFSAYQWFFLTSLLEAFLISAFFLIYGQGNLFYGGNGGGYYRYMLAPFDLYNLLGYVSLAISFSNFYVAFYIQIFVQAFLISFCLMLIVSLFLPKELGEKKIKWIPSISAFIYFFNMEAFGDTFKSFEGNLSIIQFSLALFVLTSLLIFVFEQHRKGNMAAIVVLNALSAGLALPAYPNLVRIAIIEFSWIIFLILYRIITDYAKSEEAKAGWANKRTLKNLGIWFFSFALASSFVVIPFIINIHNYVTTSSDVSSAITGVGGIPPLNIVRLFGPVNAPYDTYYSIQSSVLFYLSFIWTILGLVIPTILFLKKRGRGPLSAVLLPFGFYSIWSSGILNFIFLKFFPAEFPLLSQVFIYWEPSINIMPILFIVLIGISLGNLYVYLIKKTTDSDYKCPHSKRIISSHNRLADHGRAWKIASIVIAVGLITGIGSTMLPELKGDTFSQYYNTNINGFQIPDSYSNVYSILQRAPNSSLIIYPELSTFITTSWGYSGTIGFYNSFFYPHKTYTIATNNQYGQYIQSISNSYYNLTHPFLPAYHAPNYMFSSNNSVNMYGVQRLALNNNTYIFDSYNSSYTSLLKINFAQPLNLSNMLYLGMNIGENSSLSLMNYSEHGVIQYGLIYGNYIHWFTGKLGLLAGNGGKTEYVFSSAELSSEASKFASVSGFAIRSTTSVSNLQVNLTGLTFYSVELGGSGQLHNPYYTLNQKFATMLNKHPYIMLDNSIVAGSLESLYWEKMILELLVEDGLVTEVYHGNFIELYKLN